MDELISRQAAIEYFVTNVGFHDEDDIPIEDSDELRKIWTGYFDGIPSAQPEQRWIPVTERLPKAEMKRYWVCTDTGYQCQCRWTNSRFGIGEFGEWGWSIFDIPQYSKVVAYMPLPEPWKGEQDV